ncbi:MAG TPA: cytidine deaminase [Syntrophobacteraceae bacterium]|nr:cytidine deaminase [Syntrophobacteraceae bacterium]HBZ54931.1 cytidine deaminase [Syntrophobacteraceae bacterium]
MNCQRPSKAEYYLGIAEAVARRGTCLRRLYGAVIVNNDQIISTGYVGAPRHMKNCIDIGRCIRKEKDIPPGERYELCRSVHAEMNAIIHASRLEMVGGDLYLVGFSVEDGSYVSNSEPCKLCKRMIINSGLARVYVRRGPAKEDIVEFLVDDWIQNEESLFDIGKGSY